MPASLVLSTAFLPPLEYFIFMAAFDEVFIEKYENFNKQTYRNRACIAGANGKLCLSVPVCKFESKKSAITGIGISDHEDWRNTHWRTIESAYNASPFFLYYRDEIGSVLLDNSIKNLFDFNGRLLKWLIEETGLTCAVRYTVEYQQYPASVLDLREVIHPKKSADLLMNQYFNTSCEPYIQVFSSKFGFIPGLSIIDLLFNLGPETISYIRGHADKFNLTA